jgi:V/A-type H+-transporting ATPase subunit A
MLKTMELLYDRGLSAVKKGIPISRVRNGQIYEEVIKLKYTIPNDDISKIKEVNKMINDFYDKLESEYSK